MKNYNELFGNNKSQLTIRYSSSDDDDCDVDASSDSGVMSCVPTDISKPIMQKESPQIIAPKKEKVNKGT